MSNKSQLIASILEDKSSSIQIDNAEAFAPANIALIKYWGKRDTDLNLPVTSSLSLSLHDKGATTRLSAHDQSDDLIILNNQALNNDHPFSIRLIQYLDLFRSKESSRLKIETQSNIPIAAGLASSASGFAALIKAMDKLYDWQLDNTKLSILARLGSGSACRSLWDDVVEWHKGKREDGLDSHGVPLNINWPELNIGLLIIAKQQKPISSRDAMNITRKTSTLYKSWPEQVETDLKEIKPALKEKIFETLGSIAERNALAMHATMLSSQPAIAYSLPETLNAMQQIWQLRDAGLAVYFTQDAGPNLKLLFLEKDKNDVLAEFNDLSVV